MLLIHTHLHCVMTWIMRRNFPLVNSDVTIVSPRLLVLWYIYQTLWSVVILEYPCSGIVLSRSILSGHRQILEYVQ